MTPSVRLATRLVISPIFLDTLHTKGVQCADVNKKWSIRYLKPFNNLLLPLIKLNTYFFLHI